MKFDQKKLFTHSLYIIIIIGLVIGIILPVYISKNIYPFGDGTIAYADMAQSIPIHLFYVWDILHGKGSPFFSWNSGFGVNFSGTASQNAFFSPLNLFTLFCSRENLINFVNILLILKIICIAIAMYVYSNKYKISQVFKVIFSILYSFGAASLIHYQMNFVIDMAFLVPILMIGYDKLMKRNNCGLFIFMLFWILIENAYIGSMVVLFILLVSGVRLFLEQEDCNNKGEKAFLLGISVVLSVMMSAVIIFPALSAFSKASRTEKAIFDTYIEAIESSWQPFDWELARYMLMNLTLPIIIITYNLVIKRIKWKAFSDQIILLGFMIAPLIISGIELLWHGGSRIYWPVRFVFLITFVVIDYSMQLVQDMGLNNSGKNERVRAFAISVMGLLCAKIIFSLILKLPEINNYKQTIYLLIVCVCGIGYLGILCSQKKKINSFLFFITLEISLMSYLFIAPGIYDSGGEHVIDSLQDSQSINEKLPEHLEVFKRVKNVDGNIPIVNYSLVMGKESLANMIHTIDASFQPALRKLGYSIHYTRLLDTGGTIFSDTLFGIKYMISGSELSEELFNKIGECDGVSGVHYYIYENKYSVPFVTCIESCANELTDNYFENQNILFEATTGIREKLITEYTDIKIDESTIIEVGQKRLLYLYTDGSESIAINVNGQSIIVPAMENVMNMNYPSNFNNALISLGCFENQTVCVDFINAQNPYGIHVGLLDMELLKKGIDNINNDFAEDIKIHRKNTSVKFELDSIEETDIFIPVLYDEGWYCKVNGREQQVDNIFGFVKVHLQQGENRIQLSYKPQGQKLGGIISILGVILSIVFWLLIRNRRTYKQFEIVYKLSYILLVTSFGIVVVLFYVIPIIKYIEKLFIVQYV